MYHRKRSYHHHRISKSDVEPGNLIYSVNFSSKNILDIHILSTCTISWRTEPKLATSGSVTKVDVQTGRKVAISRKPVCTWTHNTSRPFCEYRAGLSTILQCLKTVAWITNESWPTISSLFLHGPMGAHLNHTEEDFWGRGISLWRQVFRKMRAHLGNIEKCLVQ